MVRRVRVEPLERRLLFGRRRTRGSTASRCENGGSEPCRAAARADAARNSSGRCVTQRADEEPAVGAADDREARADRCILRATSSSAAAIEVVEHVLLAARACPARCQSSPNSPPPRKLATARTPPALEAAHNCARVKRRHDVDVEPAVAVKSSAGSCRLSSAPSLRPRTSAPGVPSFDGDAQPLDLEQRRIDGRCDGFPFLGLAPLRRSRR